MSMVVDRSVTVSVLDDASEERWDRFVAERPDGTFFHRAGWRTVIERTFGHRCHFLYATAGENILGVLPLVHVTSRLFGTSLISTGFTVGGGSLAVDEPARQALDRHALELAEAFDVDYVEYRGRSPVHPDWAHKPGLYAGFVKAIDADPETNMLAIPRKQRAMVRKGIRNGLTSVIDADTRRIHHIYATSVRNLGTPVFPKRYFDNLIQVFAPDVDIVTVVDGRKAVASVMNFYFGDRVMPYYGGGLAAARALAANDVMYWEVMRRACERGYRVFDFGRSKVDTGAYAFKKNWGFEPEPWTYEYKLRRGQAVPEVNPLNPKYRLLVAAWKRLPVPLAKLIGPFVVRGVG